MELVLEGAGDVTIVTLSNPRFDVANATDFKTSVVRALGDCRKVVLDLESVRFIDSAGFTALLCVLKALGSLGGDVRLCGACHEVRATLESVGLHRIFEIHPTREDAVQSFAAVW